MYQKSSMDTVIYNIKSGCKSCATINIEQNLIFTECSVTYLISQRFDIIFEKYTNNFHSIVSKNGSYHLLFQNLSNKFELIIANGRRGFFIVSQENSYCLTNNVNNSFPYSLNNSSLFRSCKKISKNDEDIIFYFNSNLILPKTQYLAIINFIESINNESVSISQEFSDEFNSKISGVSINLLSNSESYSNLPLKPYQEMNISISESDYIFTTNIDSLVSQNYNCSYITKISETYNKIRTPYYNRERCFPNQVLQVKVALLKINTYIIKFKNETRNSVLDSSIFVPSSLITFTNGTNDLVYSYQFNQTINEIVMKFSFGMYSASFLLEKNPIYNTNINNIQFNVDNCNSNNIIYIKVNENAVLVNLEMKDIKTQINYNTSILSSSIIMINQDLNKEFVFTNQQTEFSLILNAGNHLVYFPMNNNYENLTNNFTITYDDLNQQSIFKILSIKALCKVTFKLTVNGNILSTEILETNSIIAIRNLRNNEIITYVVNEIISEISIYLELDNYIVESLNLKSIYDYYSFNIQDAF